MAYKAKEERSWNRTSLRPPGLGIGALSFIESKSQELLGEQSVPRACTPVAVLLPGVEEEDSTLIAIGRGDLGSTPHS